MNFKDKKIGDKLYYLTYPNIKELIICKIDSGYIYVCETDKCNLNNINNTPNYLLSILNTNEDIYFSDPKECMLSYINDLKQELQDKTFEITKSYISKYVGN